MSSCYIVLGNGFSIDLIHKMNKEKEIDLSNLFSKGENVVYPKTKNRGFLSSRYTPDLWSLGARTYMSGDDAMRLVTDIITCANVYVKKRSDDEDVPNRYIHAYSELSAYLRYLFIYYNSLVSNSDLNAIKDKVELISYIKNELSKGEKIYICTYNYDIFLERLLKLSGIEFDIYGFETTGKKVVLFKPHGSISFSFNIKIQESSPYSIKDRIADSISQNAEDFEIKYDLASDYPIVNAIIPPAGDAGRYQYGWIECIRKGLEQIAKESTSKDHLLLFGLSYWHVDRNEIDDILLAMDSQMDVVFVNPAPPTSLEAVLTCMFKKYIHFTSGKLIVEGT